MEWFVILSALFLSIHGYRRKSLSLDGTVVAFVIALLVFDAGLGVSFPLLAFYLSSKQVTKLGASKKLRLEEDYVVGGQRSAWQVLANGGLPTVIICVMRTYCCIGVSEELLSAYVGYYCCCCGDTWSSEVGILSPSAPRLITAPWRRVPPGTNGGVSLPGFVSSVVAGSLVGAAHAAGLALDHNVGLKRESYPLFPVYSLFMYWVSVGGGLGFLGSLLDSLLGATLQYSGVVKHHIGNEQLHLATSQPSNAAKRTCGANVLSNNQVNFVSAVLTSAVAATCTHLTFPYISNDLSSVYLLPFIRDTCSDLRIEALFDSIESLG
eukprot:Rmarinus@m.27146